MSASDGFDQKTDPQLEKLTADKVFVDKCGGKDTVLYWPRRWKAREGSTVRSLARSAGAQPVDNLPKLVSSLNEHGMTAQFVKEGLTLVGDDSPMSKLLFDLPGQLAEF